MYGLIRFHMDLQPFMEAGLDSLGAVDLRASLERALDMQLPATIIFDHPSVFALSKHVSALKMVSPF